MHHSLGVTLDIIIDGPFTLEMLHIRLGHYFTHTLSHQEFTCQQVFAWGMPCFGSVTLSIILHQEF
jgi:hypothetical protein